MSLLHASRGNLGVILVRVCEPVFQNLPHSYTWPLKKRTHSCTWLSEMLSYLYAALWFFCTHLLLVVRQISHWIHWIPREQAPRKISEQKICAYTRISENHIPGSAEKGDHSARTLVLCQIHAHHPELHAAIEDCLRQFICWTDYLLQNKTLTLKEVINGKIGSDPLITPDPANLRTVTSPVEPIGSRHRISSQVSGRLSSAGHSVFLWYERKRLVVVHYIYIYIKKKKEQESSTVTVSLFLPGSNL